MNKSDMYFEIDVTCSKDCEHNCENCRKNQCGRCSHFGVQVSKSNNCQNAARRASNI